MAEKIGTIQTDFGSFLMTIMAKKQIGQRELARRLGISHITVFRYVHNERVPDLNRLLDILQALDYRMLFVPKGGGD